MESLSRPPHRRKHSRNPYDDVFLSTGGERETLESHEYAEIFSGSSSIPVLDLSGLDARVGSPASRASKLDYSNIFGGFRNEEAGFPRQELVDGAAKKAQLRNPADKRVLPQQSDSLHSAENPKIPSGEASDQSTDEPKKQFNVSFNRTHQRNIDTSNGKTHIAQLQAVPGFTHFVDVTPFPPKTDNESTVKKPLKREVSRTWSFSAEAETIKGKSGLSREKSPVPDNKPQPRASYFVPKNDASEKNAGEFSPPFYGDDFDENSIAAASAAALKRAIDQAQESIRLAKMIMNRKKEGYHNGSKARHRGHPKVSYGQGEMDRDSKKNNFKDKNEDLDPTKFDGGINGKSTPSLIHDVKKSTGELKRTEENVEVVEAHGGGADFPVLLANEFKTANLEQREGSVDHAQGPEVVAEQVGRALDTLSQRIQELEMSVEEAGDSKATFDNAEGSECKVERVLNTPQRTRRQWKVLGETYEYFGIGQDDRLSEKRKNDMYDKGKKELREVTNVECTAELRSELDGIVNESCNLIANETLEQVEKESEPERRENGNVLKTYDDSESEEQLMEALEKEINPNVFPQIEEGEKSVDEAHEPEIDNQKENAHDEDEQNLPGEVEPNEVEVSHTNTSECNVPDTIENGEKHCAQDQKSEVFFDSEENRNSCQNDDDACEEHINETLDVNSSSSSTIDSETREACNVDFDNNPKEYQTVVENHKESDTVPEVIETISEISKNKEAEHTFHQEEDNEFPRTETLRRIYSEEIFVEKELHNDFDSLSSDGSKIENVRVVCADPEEELPENESASNTSEIHDVAQDLLSEIDLPHVHPSDIRTSEFDPEDVDLVPEEASGSDEGSVSTSSHENINGFSAHDSEECEENAKDMTPISEELQDEVDLVSNDRKLPEGQSMESEERDANTDNNKGNLAGTSPTEEKDVKEGDPQNSDKNDSQQRIDAIKRGREREKDRKAVERAIREARERAFAEARERAERAAVEKATAEARQRAMSQAREKASQVKQPVVVDKATAQAKLRAERAAVERATAEARERALVKAMSMKTTHTEGKTPEKVSGSSRSNGLKHSFSSSDLDNATESAQRRKARLERHQRIMERAAKALAEKNMRDVLAQKEQAERNRLSESLDADIKRWATGKEKNLRALLSTLQYILGADSGWQPIPLTDIVTTAAVKKAYRKATLCVHPDKLQQRGATIKQKYICEKVFDLLKAAWNRYDSDER